MTLLTNLVANVTSRVIEKRKVHITPALFPGHFSQSYWICPRLPPEVTIHLYLLGILFPSQSFPEGCLSAVICFVKFFNWISLSNILCVLISVFHSYVQGNQNVGIGKKPLKSFTESRVTPVLALGELIPRGLSRLGKEKINK